MFTSLVLSGRGIKKGATIGHVRSLDVAPDDREAAGARDAGRGGTGSD
jgi:hypothetical protein